MVPQWSPAVVHAFNESLSLRGELEREAGSVRGWVAREIALVLAGDAARDGEAQAVARFAGVKADEPFEDAFALIFGYARSVIHDVRIDVSVLPS